MRRDPSNEFQFRAFFGGQKKPHTLTLQRDSLYKFFPSSSRSLCRNRSFTGIFGMDAAQIAGLAPALDRYSGHFDDCFGRSEPAAHLRTYIKGQFSDLPRKSVEPMALADGTPPLTLQDFLVGAQWDQRYVGEVPSNFVGVVPIAESPADRIAPPGRAQGAAVPGACVDRRCGRQQGGRLAPPFQDIHPAAVGAFSHQGYHQGTDGLGSQGGEGLSQAGRTADARSLTDRRPQRAGFFGGEILHLQYPGRNTAGEAADGFDGVPGSYRGQRDDRRFADDSPRQNATLDARRGGAGIDPAQKRIGGKMPAANDVE